MADDPNIANLLGTRRWVESRSQNPAGLCREVVAVVILLLVVVSPEMHSQQQGKLHELIDPCLGTHWKLLLDALHPDRPGRLVHADLPSAAATKIGEDRTAKPAVVLAFHAGDRVMVDQQSPILQARFMGIALEPAQVGARTHVRLLAGAASQRDLHQKVVQVVATGPGEADWLAKTEEGRED